MNINNEKKQRHHEYSETVETVNTKEHAIELNVNENIRSRFVMSL